jgi:hypothetical protein
MLVNRLVETDTQRLGAAMRTDDGPLRDAKPLRAAHRQRYAAGWQSSSSLNPEEA